jgi:hypothetical protein
MGRSRVEEDARTCSSCWPHSAQKRKGQGVEGNGVWLAAATVAPHILNTMIVIATACSASTRTHPEARIKAAPATQEGAMKEGKVRGAGEGGCAEGK